MRNSALTLALSGILAFGASSALYAQDNSAAQDNTSQQQQGQQPQGQWGHGHHRMNADAQLAHMTKALNLTPDQQSQIKPILQDRDQKMQTLWQNQSLSREDRHTQMQAIQQDTHSRIEAVLNDEQKQKFESMHQHGPHGGGNESQPQ